ncbi:MAG: hypothetical protein ACJ74H_17210, partial [Thermoanaerobaculia bacterium]
MVAYAQRVNRLIVVLALLLSGCVAERDVARLPESQHTRLPASPAYTHVVFRAYVGEFSVSVDGKRIYAFHDPHFDGRLTVHVAQLPANSAGKRIDFDVPHPPRQTIFIGTAYLATVSTLPFAIDHAAALPLREDTPGIVLGIALFIIGAIALAASLIRRRGDVLALRAFGAFTLLYGARLIVDTSLP